MGFLSDKKTDGDGDENIFIPADGYRDEDEYEKVVAGTGMRVQYPPG